MKSRAASCRIWLWAKRGTSLPVSTVNNLLIPVFPVSNLTSATIPTLTRPRGHFPKFHHFPLDWTANRCTAPSDCSIKRPLKRLFETGIFVPWGRPAPHGRLPRLHPLFSTAISTITGSLSAPWSIRLFRPALVAGGSFLRRPGGLYPPFADRRVFSPITPQLLAYSQPAVVSDRHQKKPCR